MLQKTTMAALCGALLMPLQAHAAPTPYLTTMNADVQQSIRVQRDSRIPPHTLQWVMYGLQIADAINSANTQRPRLSHPRVQEMNPTMKPFSHGGVAMFLVGFGLGDLLRHAVLRHASAGAQNTSDAIQAAANLEGIMQSNAAYHKP